MAKKYRLLKDLPFAKAGDMLEMWSDGTMAFVGEPNLPRFNKEDIRMFSQWFEKVEENKVPDEYYIPVIFADKTGIIAQKISNDTVIHRPLYLNSLSIGLAFKSKEEAERYIEYLKAKEVIKQDTKGFKPDWEYGVQKKYYGYWDFYHKKFGSSYALFNKNSEIYFKSKEDIEESFEKHPEEWKTYLTYEQ